MLLDKCVHFNISKTDIEKKIDYRKCPTLNIVELACQNKEASRASWCNPAILAIPETEQDNLKFMVSLSYKASLKPA